MDIEFKNLEELKKRVGPALATKEKELKLKKYSIKKEEIWNYLVKNKWSTSKNLTLYDIVNDILKFDIEEIENQGVN